MLNTWDPLFDLLELKNQPAAARAGSAVQRRGFAPAVDLYEDEKHFFIKAELPGVRPEDIELNLDKNVLTLRGERRFERDTPSDKGVHRVERTYGSFARSFALSDLVDGENIQADLQDGILTVRLAKKPSVMPRRIQVNGVNGRSPGNGHVEAPRAEHVPVQQESQPS